MERRIKSRSAPVRRKQENADKKVSTLREITAWVQKGNADPANRKAARNTGLLTENVTEERLLFAKQLELGRERYKFLSQHAYEKQKFIERQKRKNTNSRKSRISISDYLQTKEARPRISSLPPTLLQPCAGDGQGGEGGDVAVGPLKADGRADTPPVFVEAQSPIPGQASKKDARLPKTVHFSRKPMLPRRNCYINTSDSSIEAEARPESRLVEKLPDVKATPNQSKSRVPSLKHAQERPDRFASPDYAPESPDYMYNSRTVTRSNSRATNCDKDSRETDGSSQLYFLRKSKQPTRFGQKFPASVHDPRYTALKEVLCPPLTPDTRPRLTVKDIIKQKSILQRDLKVIKEENAKLLHQKFLDFLLEKELGI